MVRVRVHLRRLLPRFGSRAPVSKEEQIRVVSEQLVDDIIGGNDDAEGAYILRSARVRHHP